MFKDFRGEMNPSKTRKIKKKIPKRIKNSESKTKSFDLENQSLGHDLDNSRIFYIILSVSISIGLIVLILFLFKLFMYPSCSTLYGCVAECLGF
jgi:ABC-type lipoprotein release transport system permease subunit